MFNAFEAISPLPKELLRPAAVGEGAAGAAFLP